MHSIIRDDRGRLVPVVRPKRWQAASVKRSRDRSDRIATRAETAEGDGWRRRSGCRRAGSPGHCRAGGDRHPVGGRPALARRGRPARGFRGRMFVKQVLQVLADDQARPSGTVRGQARALPAADRRRHCRLRTCAAEPGQYIAGRCSKNPCVHSLKTLAISSPVRPLFVVPKSDDYGTASP